MRLISLIIAGISILWIGLTGQVLAGAFEEKPIFLDAQISGQPPVNDGRRTFPVLSKDDRILIEVFVGELARGLTSGFTLAFEDDNLAFLRCSRSKVSRGS